MVQMGKLGIFNKLKLFANKVSWKVFIWSLGITQEEYWQSIYYQELYYMNRLNREDDDD